MGFLDKLQVELNRAGRAAQDAIDEGRLRLEIFRVRQLADKAAQSLGYAVYRAKAKGEEIDAAAWDRLAATLRDHEAEATRLDAELAKVKEGAPAAAAESTPPAEPAPAATADASAPADASDAPPPTGT
ncbi:MAG: hypothetical protein ACYC7F_13780 [Gemmatimonadaceae bacterium]